MDFDSPPDSPAAPSAQPPDDKQYQSGQPKSLEGIAIRSFCLGLAHASCVLTMSYMLLFTSSPLWRIYFFGGALATFHFLEFWTTAKYNTSNVMISSFLLTENWPNYFIAHTSAFFECLLTNLIAPNRSWAPFYSGHLLLLLGLIMVVVGQTARSAAMIHAGRSFNHRVQTKKRQDHELVTTGIYSYIRHPSYFGFFYWAIGTQLVLGNPLCFIMFAGVLWYFFSTRVKHEETKLVEFFKDDYVNYRKRVGTAMPFVG
ncbi:putative isoprenylcysteine carboxyl methyltransferase [Xylariaceae sp. FL0016]|nr:putative isoprenylcysteine carboxyl methyltransferase [Xylariaceae sp. FL0016]